MSDIAHSTPPKSVGTLRCILVLVLIILAGIIVLPTLFFMLLLSSVGSGSVEGPAPDDVYAVRRAWGQESLGYFGEVDKWIRSSEKIASDIGTVKGVAPIGAPNSYSEGFGECWADMNLQVIGERGEGILRLEDVGYDGTNAENWKLHGLSLTRWRVTNGEPNNN